MLIRKKGFPFSFQTKACNSCPAKCCTGASGNIIVNEQEIANISQKLQIDESIFRKDFLRVTEDGALSLREYKLGKNNYACALLEHDNKKCSIYDVRPTQCRTFPFWSEYVGNTELAQLYRKELTDECIGVQLDTK